MTEIRKVERDVNNWGDKRYAIESTLYEVATQEPVLGKQPIVEEITISSQEEFLKISAQVNQDNINSLIMADKFGNPFYTSKKIILL